MFPVIHGAQKVTVKACDIFWFFCDRIFFFFSKVTRFGVYMYMALDDLKNKSARKISVLFFFPLC